ncbi:MAG: zinc ribbon domain-containing protein [Chloroflexota bacterium]|nr:zinc ribbon domain-containing protein [Chloroflexota bacterium]
MPVYAYSCGSCGLQFERMQRFSDPPVSDCPECNEDAVQRVIQPVGIIFKGSGWYVKDSKAANSAGQPTSKDKISEQNNTAESSPKSDGSSTSENKSKTSKSSESKNSTNPVKSSSNDD